MSEKLTKEELLECLGKCWNSNPNRFACVEHKVKYNNKAYTQLNDIVEKHFWLEGTPLSDFEQGKIPVQKKPRVSREWVDQAWREIQNRWDLGYVSEKIFIAKLKEIGVEVEE